MPRIEDDALWLKVPGIADPCRLPIDGLRSLVVLSHETADTPKPDQDEKGEFTGRLEMDGLLLPGQLAESPRGAATGPLVWKPDGSLSAAGLRPNASGKIIYKDPTPPKSASVIAAENQQRVRVVQAAPVGVAQGFLRALTTAAPPQQTGSAGGRRAIHLRTGDIIPSEITRIDEKGVSFKTTISDSTFVPREGQGRRTGPSAERPW